MERVRKVTWTYVKGKGILEKYGVQDVLSIKDAFVKIVQFNDVASFRQRLDILVRRNDGSTDYYKKRILSDLDENKIKLDFPDIKTVMKFDI